VGLATPAVKSSHDTAEERPGGRSPAPFLVLGCYLLGALYLTARVWVNPAVLAQSGDMHDVDQMSWFMRYSELAVAHFHLPALVTSAMNAPHTVNLMWNTSLLLPGIIMSPITAIAGPQVSLNLLLVLGFAGSAASLYFVLRRWGASIIASAIGGALYGFSPAMIASGIGHYHLVLALVPPLIIDALLRIVTGRGSAIRNALWLGLLAAVQLFIGEEALIDTIIAGAVLLIVLAACRPRGLVQQARRSLAGLATAAGVALVLCSYGLWKQFHGVSLASSGAIPVVQHLHKLTHLYTIPYAFVVPSSKMIIHTGASAQIYEMYPQPAPEYLAYLGIPLIIVLLAAGVYFWKQLPIRIAFLTFLLLELLSLGGQKIGPYPGALLPWYWIQSLPLLRSVLPDRLSILADGMAAVVLAFAIDQVRVRWANPAKGWRNPAVLGVGVAVLALLPLVPVPYSPAKANRVPAGYAATWTAMHLAHNARVLVVPVPNGALTNPLRWYADRGYPQQMIGGDFIDASKRGRTSRSGRSAETQLGDYLNSLLGFPPPAPVVVRQPTQAQVRAQMAVWNPAAIVANTSPDSPLGIFLIKEFGRPTVQEHKWLGWLLSPTGK
jgi:hypothetical protein